MSETIKSIGAVVVSVIAALIAVWWLALVAQRLGVKPVVNDKGAVELDEFQRAKDILLVVLPLFSAAVAFWVGNSGAKDAKQEAAEDKKKLNAVIDVSGEGILEKAQDAHPEAFA